MRWFTEIDTLPLEDNFQFCWYRLFLRNLSVFVRRFDIDMNITDHIDSAAVSIFEVILVELTNTVFVDSTNIETAVLSQTIH